MYYFTILTFFFVDNSELISVIVLNFFCNQGNGSAEGLNNKVKEIKKHLAE